MERVAIPAGRRPVRRPKRLLALRSDERLVGDVRSGDDAAFEVLYERHVAGLLGFCRHMLGSQHEAEDAVQQAFVSAHRDMLRGAREINFKPWLYTIARNRCLSMLRARREQPAELQELSTAGLADSVEQRSDLRELVADVHRLPDDQRAALVLSELGDLSHAEIADVIGVEPVAVKGIVFRARSALIERREARNADCREIREELEVATGGALRRSRLRYHLEGCPACQAYLGEVRRQRKLLGVALPAVPTLALHDSVMAAAGVGTAGAAATGALAGGGAAAGGAAGSVAATTAPLLGGTLAKVAVVGVLAVGGAGVATEVVRERGGDGGSNPPAQSDGGVDGAAGGAGSGSTGAGNDSAKSDERSHGARGKERRERGWRRAQERSDGRSSAGAKDGSPGRSGDRPANGKGKVEENNGKAIGQGQSPPQAGGGQESGKAPADPGRSGGRSGGTQRAVPERGPPESSNAPAEPPGQVQQPASKKTK